VTARGPYQLKHRADAAARTRQRCIDAARAVIADVGLHRLTLVAVAEGAGVSRPTVYEQFGSKLGLIDAITVDLDRRGGVERLLAAFVIEDPVESVRASLHAGYAVYDTDPELLRQLYAMAATDPDVAELMAVREGGRRSVVLGLVARLADTQRLRTGVSAEDAAAVLLVLTHFATFDQLRAVSGARPPAELAIIVLGRVLLEGSS